MIRHISPAAEARPHGDCEPPAIGTRWLLWLLVALAPTPRLWATDSWAASPYRIHVWLACEPVPEIVATADRMPAEIRQVAEATFGAAWELEVAPPPSELLFSQLESLADITLEAIAAADAALLERDKLFLVAVRPMNGGWTVTTRELDCRTRSWQAIRRLVVRQTDRLGQAVGDEIIRAFTPIGLVGRSLDDHVEVTMRAGLLTGGAELERLMPPPGSVLRTVLRKNDRLGKLAPNGVQAIPWTLLQVEAIDFADATCSIVSGLRNPFRSRSTRQVEKIALLARPTLDQTVLRLVAKGDTNTTLTGYDIYARLPGEKTSTFVGRTDWRGQVVVKRDQDPIKIMYVKNGGRLLARLPLVPGFETTTIAELVDDSARLEAEGFLTGIQEQMVEVMARQQVYAIRIRRALENQQLDKAESLLDELSSLPTREDLLLAVRDRQQALTSDNRAVQDRIDRMFRETRGLIQKYVSNSLIDQLRSEVLAARRP